MFRGPMSDARWATTPERRPEVPRSIVIALHIHVEERELVACQTCTPDYAALRLRFDLVLRPWIDVLARFPRLCRRASMRLMTLSVRSGGGGSSIVRPLALRRISFFLESARIKFGLLRLENACCEVDHVLADLRRRHAEKTVLLVADFIIVAQRGAEQ